MVSTEGQHHIALESTQHCSTSDTWNASQNLQAKCEEVIDINLRKFIDAYRMCACSQRPEQAKAFRANMKAQPHLTGLPAHLQRPYPMPPLPWVLPIFTTVLSAILASHGAFEPSQHVSNIFCEQLGRCLPLLPPEGILGCASFMT